jgi:hypothetical protein
MVDQLVIETNVHPDRRGRQPIPGGGGRRTAAADPADGGEPAQ